MAVLETLEGDNMAPEILCVGGFPNMARASLKAWEPSMADVLNRKPKRRALIPGMSAKLRARAANKATATYKTSRERRTTPPTGIAGSRPYGGSAGRFVMVGDEFDPESLEGWLTDLRKGTTKAVSAVAGVGSKVIRGAGSVQMSVLRSVAPVAGTFAGKAFAAYTGNPSAMSGGGGMMDSLMSSFGMGGGSAPAPEGSPATMPATGGGIPPIYLIGGGALLLVLLLKK